MDHNGTKKDSGKRFLCSLSTVTRAQIRSFRRWLANVIAVVFRHQVLESQQQERQSPSVGFVNSIAEIQ